MIRITQIRLRPKQPPEELEKKIRKLLKLRQGERFRYEVVKCSIDARKKPEIFYSYTVDVGGLKDEAVLKRCANRQVARIEPVSYVFPSPGSRRLADRPLIIGTGPAGLFCGYMLALSGYRPILLERGMDVGRRRKEVERFWQTGVLNPECNVQFGEGGAGTFSDGKLNTLVRDKDGKNREVLSILVKAGAPKSILYDGKPHIGTDVLMRVVKNMRQAILAHGGEVLFDTRVKDVLLENNRIRGVVTQRGTMAAEVVVLAIGHSARDTFQMLYERQIPMEAKSFAVGLRVEHPQSLIDRSQYGREEREMLPPASYKLTAQTEEGRGVYSFCMCPGGYVVNASSEEGRLSVNGMSYSGRDGANANSAVIVSVTPEDFGSSHPLGGIAFQRRLEERAYAVGKGKIPVEYYGEFKQYVTEADRLGRSGQGSDSLQSASDSGRQGSDSLQSASDSGRQGSDSLQSVSDSGRQSSDSLQSASDSGRQGSDSLQSISDSGRQSSDSLQSASGSGRQGNDSLQSGSGSSGQGNDSVQASSGRQLKSFLPQNKGQWEFSPVHEILPPDLNKAFVEGMEQFGRMIPGFADGHVLLSGVESRTSSPVRIHRDEGGQSPVRGLYPCGEGAGYAGGIMSAAMDGIRVAEWIARKYRPMQHMDI